MLISFYEEFPTDRNLQKLGLFDFRTKLYLAAHSLDEFKKLREKALALRRDIQEIVYWPLLDRREGYWLSPWSSRSALERVVGEVKKEGNIGMMWDAEVPVRNLSLTPDFFGNRRLISRFFKHASKVGIRIYVSELFLGRWTEGILKTVGLSFDPRRYGNWKILMLYSSIFRDKWGTDSRVIREQGSKGVRRYGDKFILGLGVIATGVGGNEPLLSPNELATDLESASLSGVREVVIFRLGGLTRAYLEVMERFVS